MSAMSVAPIVLDFTTLKAQLDQLAVTQPKSSGGKRGRAMNSTKAAILAALTNLVKQSPLEGNCGLSLADFSGWIDQTENESDLEFHERLTMEVSKIVREALDSVNPRGEVNDGNGRVRPAPRQSDVIRAFLPTFFDSNGHLIPRNSGESLTDYAQRVQRSYDGFRRHDGYYGSLDGSNPMVYIIWEKR